MTKTLYIKLLFLKTETNTFIESSIKKLTYQKNQFFYKLVQQTDKQTDHRID